MSWFAAARARLALVFSGRAAEARMDEEIGFHIEMETERLVREEGLSRDDARRRALVTFGGVTQHRETLRDGRGLAWMSGLSLDGRLALRMLRKNPGLTLVAVVGMSVAVAIGAVAFSAIYTMLDANLPVSEGSRVIGIRNLDVRGGEGRFTHLHDLSVWKQTLTTVSELGAYRTVDRNLITLDGHSEPARVAEMSASGFRITRVPPQLGRYFHDEDERPGAEPVVVISHRVWQSRFAGRADVVGQVLQIGDVRHTIIGVMPEGYAFPVNNRVWTPLRLDPADYERGHAPSIEVFGRLAPTATLEDAQRQIAAVAGRLAKEEPRTHEQVRSRLLPYTRMFIDNPEMTWTYHLIQLLVSLLLVVIGTNVAVLVYARTAGRLGEIAVRTALGASRARVVGQLFAEGLALSLVAAGVGLVVAGVALAAIDAALTRLTGEQLPYWLVFHITPGVVAYCLGLAVVAAVIIGAVPALKATGRDVRSNLQHLGAGGSGVRLGRGWTFMIIAQVTVAVAVLPIAIAGINAWRRSDSARARTLNRQVLTSTLSLDAPEVPGRSSASTDRATRFVALRGALVERLRAEPGVADVIFASNAPGDEATMRMEGDRAQGAREGEKGIATVGATNIDLDYLRVFGIGVLAGRAFEAGDYSPASDAILVNRSFVKKVFGGGSPLGRKVRRAAPEGRAKATDARWETIVGVVPDFPVDSSSSAPKVYRPLLPADTAPVMIAIRMKGMEASQLSSRLRALAVATNPLLRVEQIKSLDETIYDNAAPTRMVILVIELVTGATVLLSAAGIYALMAFTVTRRRREIGIRAALGAGPRRVLGNVLASVMVQVAIGIAIGVSIAGTFDHFLEGGWTGRLGFMGLASVAALMGAVAIGSAIGPAARALRIQPTEALKGV